MENNVSEEQLVVPVKTINQHIQESIYSFPVAFGLCFLALAVLIAALLISGSVLYMGYRFSKANSTAAVATGIAQTGDSLGQQPALAVDIAKVKLDGQPFVGNPNARVTIAYWFDYQCPFCHKFEQEVIPTLIEKYVTAGKARIVFKDFQFLGDDSQTIGLWARAVWETAPDKFYLWHKALYDNQGTENTGWATKDKLESIAKSVSGLDVNRIEQLMISKKSDYQKAMDADKAEGSGFGVSGTPSLIIGKQIVVGAQPLAVLETAIDKALAQ